MLRVEAPDSLEYPRIVFVDLSTACNATCVMCPTQLNPLRKKIISASLFESVVDQVAALPANDMFFIGVHGEPLLDRRLPEKVSLCRTRGLDNILISTNGSLLDEQRARELLDASPHIIIISLESMNPAVFEDIRKGLKHADVVANIKTTFRVRNEIGSRTRIGIRFIQSDRNARERNAFMRYWLPYLDRAKKDFFEIDRIHNWGYGTPGKFYGSSPCFHTKCMTILSDGSVVFCCLDHEGIHLFGNATEQPLLQIFNSEKAKKFRSFHLAGQAPTLHLCQTGDVAEPRVGKPLEPLYERFVAADWMSTSTGGGAGAA